MSKKKKLTSTRRKSDLLKGPSHECGIDHALLSVSESILKMLYEQGPQTFQQLHNKLRVSLKASVRLGTFT